MRRGTRPGQRWCTTFAKSLWTCFLSLQRWSTGSVEVDRTIEHLTRKQQQTGLVANRKPNIGEEALTYAKHIEALAGLNTMVVCIDNYNKWRYSGNVARERNISINATCVAMLPVPTPEGGFPLFRGVKGIPDLISDIGDLPRAAAGLSLFPWENR